LNLEPVRQARLARSRAEAARLLAQARQEAAAAVAAAELEAQRVVDDARELGRRESAVRDEEHAAHSVSEARELVLAAQRLAWESLTAAAVEAASALRAEPGYPELLDRVRALGRAQLGQGASEQEGDGGGVILRAGSRRVDYSLPALARRGLQELGGRVTELWR
jgi:hypothetical protein